MSADFAIPIGCIVVIAIAAPMACGVTPTQHAANVAESVQYAAELTKCRDDAKLDGGWDAYQACACRADAKHGTDAGVCP